MSKILLTLFAGILGFGSFCSAELIGSFNCENSGYKPCGDGFIIFPPNCDTVSIYFYSDYKFAIDKYNLNGSFFQSIPQATSDVYSFNCSEVSKIQIKSPPGWVSPSPTFPYTVSFGTDPNGGGSCPDCPGVNTGEILSGYILESEIDTNYCVNNDLCPVYENNSLLYINTIEHQSAPVINIDIPLEYDRDSSIDSGTFNLVISGNNVDYDYIDGIITTQNSKPSSEDFNKIITVLLPVFIPGLVIILFLFFIFKFIKKVF